MKVGKWRRYEVSLLNPSYTGNPFDVIVEGLFTHVPTGRQLTQFGFFAGESVWKIYFMPDMVGPWIYETRSTDPDLEGTTGEFLCVPSGLPGKLDGRENRWVLSDGAVEFPIMIPTRQWFKRSLTSEGIDDFIHWARETVGARIIGTTLVYFGHEADEVPYLKGQEGIRFNIPMWDRLNSHYDRMRDRGIGIYLMFYSDDDESPNEFGIHGRSEEELRLFRYALARFAAYPIVLWDSGVDIGETRSNDWIDWFAEYFLAHDPWQHPVGSRSGGGSGGKNPQNATYYSDGARDLPSRQQLLEQQGERSLPTAFTDRWREDYGRGDFDRTKIRRAVWQVALAGPMAVYVSGNEHSGYLGPDYAQDFRAAAECGYAARFFRERVKNLQNLKPHDELVVSGEAVLSADLYQEYVAYLPTGGAVQIDLQGAGGSFTGGWYNPRTGEFQATGERRGGGVETFSAPSGQDWVLYLLQN